MSFEDRLGGYREHSDDQDVARPRAVAGNRDPDSVSSLRLRPPTRGAAQR
jgi:hypothetical protein